ncbi:MAG: hypothetical protein HKM95_16990 [Inquilinus sp.]|nr:hypothetical protein [Inquilinus sp.]
MNTSKSRRVIASVAGLLLLVIGPSGCASLRCNCPTETTSVRAVILPGASFTDVDLRVPDCGSKEFLVHGVHVGPEVVGGATQSSVVNLQKWAVSVPVYQRNTGGSIKVSFNVLGEGPVHLSSSLPGGQAILYPNLSTLPIRVSLLGGVTASHRFEFNIHVAGSCGNAFVWSP